MKFWTVSLLSGLWLTTATAREPSGPALAEVAAAADLVAVVQVADTDYEYVRDFPSGGTAFLRILIPYKLPHPVEDLIEVYEEGLHEHECYFDNPTVFEEGRRHLLFVRHNPEIEGQFLGMEPGCALDVLVTRDNRYALRYPLHGMALADDLQALAKPMEFHDNYAVVTYEEIPVGDRRRLLEAGYLEELEDDRFRFTHGIELSKIRKLMGEENLTMDRTLRRPSAIENP